jgi:hypothetical protein
MGYDWQTCYNDLTKQGLTPCDGAALPYHCTAFQETDAYHATCANDQAMYTPVQAIVCQDTAGDIKVFPTKELITGCMALAAQNPTAGWALNNCYCCCSCFANGTLIGIPTGNEEVQKLNVGEEILAGSINGLNSLDWKPRRLTFSSGTAKGTQPGMVYIAYGDNKDLILSPDHVLMLSDGKLTTAMKLIPGAFLMGANGEPVPIYTVSLGAYRGGVHHIATDSEFNGSVDGHLINSNGIVSGDYTLQLYFNSLGDEHKAKDYTHLATIGTNDYTKKYARLNHSNGYMSTSIDSKMMQILRSDKFSVYKHIGVNVPLDSAALWSPAQAEDILNNGTQFPLVSKIGLANANYAIKLLGGFFPDINIYLEWNRLEPNIYAINEYGMKNVIVSGGLARMEGITFRGLTMLIAHGIARFEAGAPKNYLGFACTGYADFYAFAAIARWIWYESQLIANALPAYNEVAAIFALITPQNAGGNPLDICNDPSVECRLSAMQSGFAGGSLPDCAGGKPMPSIALQQATGTADKVTLTLSTGVTSDSASKIDNYSFLPSAEVIKAEVDKDRDFLVNILGEFTPGEKYTVTIKGLVSVYNTGVDAKHNSAAFTVPKTPES